MSKLGPKCQYFVWPPLFSSTAWTLLGMEFTRASQVASGVLFHSSMMASRSWWMLEILRSSTFRLRMPHRYSIGFKSGDRLGLYHQAITFTLSFLATQWSLSCWNTALQPSLQREGIMLCFRMSQYMLAFMVSSMNCSSPVLTALMQPSANCLWAFVCIIFRRGFLLGRQPYRPIWCSVRRMVWALTGWPPTPSTSAAMLEALIHLISQTQPLDMTVSTCTQLLWSTMARPVLSGTFPVKLLYGLGHRAAAQFRGFGNLLIAHLYVVQQ